MKFLGRLRFTVKIKKKKSWVEASVWKMYATMTK